MQAGSQFTVVSYSTWSSIWFFALPLNALTPPDAHIQMPNMHIIKQ